MTAGCLMVQGSSSSAGKSLLVTALCRVYARRGLRVVPFKAQNMSNNAAACASGGEIGRAQALQAQAAGIEPTVEMNPILIKPEADAYSQVIVNGRVWKSLPASQYYEHKDFLWGQVTGALDSLRAEYDLVIIEGAGSPAELNLLPGDIVNMSVARYARSPVLLVGDIDRGGIFAQLLGTLWLLQPEERELVRGLVVNKFRGDPSLFEAGVAILEEKGGIPVLGVIPYIKALLLADEDAVALDEPGSGVAKTGLDIAAIRLPHISNFDDFDPLKMEPGVSLRYVHRLEELGSPDAILLPGTKSTSSDLDWLHHSGLADAIGAFAGQGGAVAGICGGYQMLGKNLADPLHLESKKEIIAGLGLLPVATEFQPEKTTRQTRALIEGGPSWLKGLKGQTLNGYEIHNGETSTSEPFLRIVERNGSAVSVADGAVGGDGRVWGCYLHGIFANDEFRRAWLRSLGWQEPGMAAVDSRLMVEREIDRLADAVEASLQMELLDRIIQFE